MPDNNSSNVEERFLTDEDFLKIPGIYFDTASERYDYKRFIKTQHLATR